MWGFFLCFCRFHIAGSIQSDSAQHQWPSHFVSGHFLQAIKMCTFLWVILYQTVFQLFQEQSASLFEWWKLLIEVLHILDFTATFWPVCGKNFQVVCFRAVCGRIETTIQGLPPPYRLNKPLMSLITSPEVRQPGKAPNYSVNWTTGRAIQLSRYCISRTIRRTFFPEKCDLNSTCVLYTEGKYLFPNLWMSLHLLYDIFIMR